MNIAMNWLRTITNIPQHPTSYTHCPYPRPRYSTSNPPPPSHLIHFLLCGSASVGSPWPSASSAHPPAPSVSSCSSPAPPACSSPLSICWSNLFGRGDGKDGGQRDSAKSNSAVEQNNTNPIHVGVVGSYCREYSIFLPHFPLGHTCAYVVCMSNEAFQAICENNQSACTSL